jgi:glutathione S-transferase
MFAYRLTALATLAMVAVYFWTMMRVGDARRAHNVQPPSTTGPEAFDRVYRAHVNTLEQLALMVPALWLFAATIGDVWAAGVGALWVVGRVMYVIGYSAATQQRLPGFMITATAFGIAFCGSLVALLWSFAR